MSRNLKRLVAAVLAVTVSGSFIVICRAGGPGKKTLMDPRGEPSGLKSGITECYKVWFEDGKWHIHVVNGRGTRDHRYQGTVTVENGLIDNIHSNLAKKNGEAAQWKHGGKKNEISWDFATPEKEDGIDFKVTKGATAVTFTLMIDNKEVPEQIFIGKLGSRPDSSSFAMAADPTGNPAKKVSATPPTTGKK